MVREEAPGKSTANSASPLRPARPLRQSRAQSIPHTRQQTLGEGVPAASLNTAESGHPQHGKPERRRPRPLLIGS